MIRTIVPGLANSQYVYYRLLQSTLVEGERWLDVGCGQSLLPAWLDDTLPKQLSLVARCADVVGIDAADDRPHLAEISKVIGTVYTLPFPDDAFTLVTANMVAEHLDRPKEALREIFRVLAPGGRLMIHTPNRRSPIIFTSLLAPKWLRSVVARLFDGRDSVDVFPTYYRCNTAHAIRQLAGETGFVAPSAELHHLETSPFFANVVPLLFPEFIAMRILRSEFLSGFRPDILAVLRKPLSIHARRTSVPLHSLEA